jgi:hypothetical protein
MGYWYRSDGTVGSVISWDSSSLADRLKRLKTRFTRDRLSEVPWSARVYIGDLAAIEEFIESRGPRGFGGAVTWHALQGAYPVEVAAIRDELEHGVYLSPDEFRRRDAEQKDEDERRRDQARREREQRESRETEQLRALWLKLGGHL